MEKTLYDMMDWAGIEELHYEVPEGQYFMMGDNRNYSADARFWRFSYISKDKIIAKVLFKYFPGFGKIE